MTQNNFFIKTFEEIINSFYEEDYLLVSRQCLNIVNNNEQFKQYMPFVKFFKIYADAFRIWQITYQYYLVKTKFKMATEVISHELEQLYSNQPIPADHRLLAEALCALSDIAYYGVWVENSIITNDPYALREYTDKAFKRTEDCLAATDKLETLKNAGQLDVVISKIADWLKKYVTCLHKFHDGANACAIIYEQILSHGRCDEKIFSEQQHRATSSLKYLEGKEDAEGSPEMASELNAHWHHMQKHHEATKDGKHSSLRLAEGRLVTSLSAACNNVLAQQIVAEGEPPQSFTASLEKSLGKKIWKAANLRYLPLHDVFATSFGEDALRACALDLPDLRVTFLNNKEYKFSPKIRLSALGVCTVYFQLDIGLDNMPEDLPIEEMRALQSCVCPHAGEFKIEFDESEIDESERYVISSKDHFLSQYVFSPDFDGTIDFVELKKRFNELEKLIEKKKTEKLFSELSTNIGAVLGEINKIYDEAIRTPISSSEKDHQKAYKELKNRLGKFYNSFKECYDNIEDVSLTKELITSLRKIHRCTNIYSNFRTISYLFMNHIKKYFLNELNSLTNKEVNKWFKKKEIRKNMTKYRIINILDRNEQIWHFSPNTGWHTYLYATSIMEIKPDNQTSTRVGYNELTGEKGLTAPHRDLKGFIINQREARASLDDWRFVKEPKSNNLAQIRSHDTDAFYCNEYQAFIYFPDDPQYIVDQYEETVVLTKWIDTKLNYYEYITHTLSKNLQDNILTENQDDYAEITLLKSEVHEMQSLVKKSGFSKHQDHGELMRRLMVNVNLDQSVALIDRHLNNLEELSKYLLEHIKELRSKRRTKWITGLLAAAAFVPVLDDGIRINFVKDKISEICSSCRGIGIGFNEFHFIYSVIIVATVALIFYKFTK